MSIDCGMCGNNCTEGPSPEPRYLVMTAGEFRHAITFATFAEATNAAHIDAIANDETMYVARLEREHGPRGEMKDLSSGVSAAVVRSHPEYVAMLKTLSEAQARCTRLEAEARACRVDVCQRRSALPAEWRGTPEQRRPDLALQVGVHPTE